MKIPYNHQNGLRELKRLAMEGFLPLIICSSTGTVMILLGTDKEEYMDVSEQIIEASESADVPMQDFATAFPTEPLTMQCPSAKEAGEFAKAATPILRSIFNNEEPEQY